MSQTNANHIEYRGYTLDAVQHGPGWRVHIWPGPQFLRTQPDHVSAATKEEAFTKARAGMMGGGGMMHPESMGHEMMMRILFALMDSDGDGTISLQEFQAAHERIFRAMDANKDGRLTLEEIQAFMHGARTPVPRH